MYKCECCNKNFKNFQGKANHVRWNHKDNTEYLKNASDVAKNTNEKIYGKWVEEDVKCSKENCNNIVHIKYREEKKKEKYFCSRSCANSRKWTEADKKKKSISAKNSVKVKSANSSVEKRKFLSENAKKQSREGKTNFKILHSKEVREKIKNTKLEKRKEWLLSEDFKNKKEYRKRCQFRFDLKDYPEEFDFQLIEKYGWYTASNRGGNINGISRDHAYSISEGFKNKIDPVLISHPANCKLLRHEENFHVKGSKCSITIDELKKLINIWNNKYK
jgi:hypothetical protein